jgi:hypothetical protein
MLMTDQFPSGFSAPLGATQDAGESAGEVTTTLAELERKLRELERELTSIGRRRVRAGGDTTATSSLMPATSSLTPAEAALGEQAGQGQAGLAEGRLVDERLEPVRAPLPVQPAPVHRPPPPPPPHSHVAPPSEPPPTDTDERPRPTEAQLAMLAELRRFRERLERFANELTADYDAVLARAMAGIAGRVPAEPLASAATPASREPLFEGRVELGVGPFYDIGSLGTFEQQVASVPNVSEVSVRRFEASHAVVDLRLSAPVALLGELARVLDADFGVRQVAPGRIVLSFDEV